GCRRGLAGGSLLGGCGSAESLPFRLQIADRGLGLLLLTRSMGDLVACLREPLVDLGEVAFASRRGLPGLRLLVLCHRASRCQPPLASADRRQAASCEPKVNGLLTTRGAATRPPGDHA